MEKFTLKSLMPDPSKEELDAWTEKNRKNQERAKKAAITRRKNKGGK